MKFKPLFVFLQPSRGAVSRLMESMAADEDFEPNQDSSFSEDELVPRAATVYQRGPPHLVSTQTHRHTHCLCLHTLKLLCS